MAAAVFLAVAAGLPLGLFMGRNKTWDVYLAPAVYLTYPVPKIVLLPIILLLLGLGDASKVAIIALILFSQILVTVRDAVRGIDEEYFLAVRSLNARGWAVLRHIVLPATVSELLTALRISVGTAMAVLFFVESIGARRGLGYFIQDAWAGTCVPAKLRMKVNALITTWLAHAICADTAVRKPDAARPLPPGSQGLGTPPPKLSVASLGRPIREARHGAHHRYLTGRTYALRFAKAGWRVNQPTTGTLPETLHPDALPRRTGFTGP